MSPSARRIVFMGTPEFAVEPLKTLVASGWEIAAVVTAPDKPAGRGKQLRSPAVKQYAQDHLNCPILQPEKLRDPAFIQTLESLGAPFFVVVAFRMLPEVVWTIPEKGTINLHASLLPHYRGAAPINWCIINGEKETGLTTFLINQEIDTGRILLQEKVEIADDETAGSLHDRMMLLGGPLLAKTLEQLNRGTVEPVDQEKFNIPADQLKGAPRIYREDCAIDWNQSCETIYNKVRGLNPYPAAHTFLQCPGQQVIQFKIYEVTPMDACEGSVPGTILSDRKKVLRIVCGDGCLEVGLLQPAGKKIMSPGEYLRGLHLDINDCRMVQDPAS